MQVSCAVRKNKASAMLVEELRGLGINPIVTPLVIRAVYDGPDEKLGDAIVALYEKEVDAEITAFKPQRGSPQKKKRKKR